MRTATTLLPWLVLLGSCSSPPKPPTVDESQKRPVNTRAAIELQVCRSDLQNTRILVTESSQAAQTTAATLAHLAARQQVSARVQAVGEPMKANSVFTVRFDYGSSRIVVPTDIAAALIDEARSAPLVLLRGRTDGVNDSPAESRIARQRAAAVQAYLVDAGVDPARIRATYQPAGDPVADNATAQGRELNRRVEIEVYRVRPVAWRAGTGPQP